MTDNHVSPVRARLSRVFPSSGREIIATPVSRRYSLSPLFSILALTSPRRAPRTFVVDLKVRGRISGRDAATVARISRP